MHERKSLFVVDKTKALNLHIPLATTENSTGTGNLDLVQTQSQLKIVQRQQVTTLPISGTTQSV